MIDIGFDRQCVFAPELIDFRKTTAYTEVHEPVRREIAMIHDAPWESDMCIWHNFFFDDSYPGHDGTHHEGVYRMYYIIRKKDGNTIGYAESADGIRWEKPDPETVCVRTELEDGMIGTGPKGSLDAFFVFRDGNPACEPEKKYKAVITLTNPKRLYALFSADGFRFVPGTLLYENGLTVNGMFDSLTPMFWDEREQTYRCYFRNNFFPNIRPEPRFNASTIHSVCYMEAENPENFKKFKPLYFMGREFCPLNAGNVMPYFRAPQLLIGFASRYADRKAWTPNYDELGGKEKRIDRMAGGPGLGLGLTDCVFMTSFDGKSFRRFESAFLRPGPESGSNWFPEDCTPAYGLAVTKSHVPGEEDELSLYVPENNGLGGTPVLARYTIRKDGFVSLHADGEREETVYTQEFICNGSELYANFSTSARGYLYFRLLDQNAIYESTETFGDATDRRIAFMPGTIRSLKGHKVRLAVRMRDADLYSFRFGE